MSTSHPQQQMEANVTNGVKMSGVHEEFVVPASIAQERFWLLDRLEPGNTSLNMPLALDIKGKLNEEVLRAAVREIVSRHEILRTTFCLEGTKPIQVIGADPEPSFETIDLSGRPDRVDEKDRLLLSEAHEQFDLVRGPLFRCRLIKLEDRHHVLLLTLHHIICDGWSNGVLVREIGQAYESLSNGCEVRLPELPIQYADYAVWQRDWLKSASFDEQVSYWKGKLGSELPALDLPTDFPRKSSGTSHGAIESLLLPHGLTRAIKALGHREELTNYMIFLGAFKVLLGLYSRQEEILIGSPTANRFPPETESLIGPFANTLLLKSDLSGDPTIRQFLSRTREVVLGAFSNSEVPFERLIETVRPAQGRRFGQLFQVLFIYQAAFMQPMEFNDVRIDPIRSVSPGSIFDLSLGVVERGEGVRLQLEYNTDLFRSETIRGMLGDIEKILKTAVLDLDRNISRIIERDQNSPPIDAVRESDTRKGSAVKVVTTTTEDRVLETLKEIWKEVLHVDAVDESDDFFECGGHSFLAAQLFNEISGKLGVNLTLATLFKASTVGQLADVICQEKPRDKWTSLVPIKPEGSKTPLFLMHAAGGNVLFYKDFAERLDAEQPCYGMQAVGLDGHQSAYERIEDMAAHYVREIREVQPVGPYCLGGSSMGGLIAFEAAKQLSAAGEKIRLIAMLDTYAPGNPKRIPNASPVGIVILGIADRIQHHLDTVRLLETDKRWPYVVSKLIKVRNALRRSYLKKKRGIVSLMRNRLGKGLPDPLVVTQNAISVAVKNYKPEAADLDIVLFRATKQIRGTEHHETLGWSEFTTGRIEVHEVNGSHGTIVAEPRVRFVTDVLEKILEADATGPNDD